ncbi:MAG TPA: cupin-like domain-containing protein [Polyangiaceae bacterium]|nr:cupin-like domain-containing protein [Polyangiaceae bacterium]
MSDPIQEIFGLPAPELFEKPELFVQHGPLERFPAFMRNGPMQSTDALCREYSGRLEVANGSVADGVQIAVSDAHPSVLLRLGLTVYFSDLGRTIPQSNAWLRRLEQSLGLPECAAIMAFANAPGSGLSLHHDRFDQLFFQIRGEKQFRYAPNDFVANPDVQFSPFTASQAEWGQSYRHGFPLTSEEVLKRPFETAHLRPGSAFFMPGGTWHTTAEQETDSLSVVVAVRAPSHWDLAQNLLHYYATQAPAWRARSYGGWASEGERRTREHRALAELMCDLATRLERLPAEDAYSAWSVHGYTVGTQSTYPLHARFERFVRLPNSSVRFEDDPALGKLRCIVRSGPTHRPQAETVLAFHAVARPVVDWVLDTHAAFSVSEVVEKFPDFTRADLEDLLAWLGHAALIRPIPAPEWDAT